MVGLNYGMVLKSNLKVVAMYRYSRNVLKTNVYIGLLMIKLADTNYVNDVIPGKVLYKPVYKSYDYESYNSKCLIIMA